MKISKKISITGLLVIVAVLSCFTFSCRKASEKASEKLMEKTLENATGQKTDVDINGQNAIIKTEGSTINVDYNAKAWPKEIPGDVPEFTYGKVKGVTTTEIDGQKVWNINFDDVKEGFVDKYDAQLKEKGFETVTMKMGEKGGSITGEHEKYTIFLMGNDGTISLSLGLKPKE
ncbi:MAG: hypothetical protein JXR31_10190 [Prolixibacteraceae bacterium]|nr:hypothetical protein [Prolixibacteraceae bacterium]MBN2774607.1 hypothetical protein [Prolixibacteraceae bacterium]